ncbi:hypothetical protein SAMN05192583_2186 [Sphingomonas gellani]|uniref:DUF429 domain-containing protein n=1 Tax=Sphingomonas gellani TaxID=1166340 RepID=A0A1H8EJG2_9SPHN|nr:hypothetical protein [Sphingomonas gellani]SEN18997.1 hypothetical protein SAMN05192583_2186 [Sphingomonas gellani]
MSRPPDADRFAHFAAIDWSGAAGERHAGIAVALCSNGTSAPRLVRPGHRWSRQELLHWLSDDLPPDTIVGMDLGMSLPFADVGAFFPGWPDSPPDARALWAMIDALAADDAHLSVGSVVDHPVVSRYFRRHGGRLGDRFGTAPRGRFRLTELAQARHGCRPYSNFNLVGAAQVGKSSLTGMRVLHRLGRHLSVWPFDPLPATGSVVLEIYTTIAAMAAGRSPGASKMRDHAALNAALAQLGSAPVPGHGAIADHASDALLTAAWLRRAATDTALWQPEGLASVRETEGWTFGAR